MAARGKGRRLIEWLLLAPQMREAQAHRLDREQRDCVALARGAEQLARSTDGVTAPGGNVWPQGALHALYTEVAYWALRAQAPSAARAGDGGLRALVQRIGDAALEEFLGPERASDLREALLLSHDQLALLVAEQWVPILDRTASAARKALETAEAPERLIRRLRLLQVGRIFAIPALCAFLIVYHLSPRELAHGKPWIATSGLGAPVAGVLKGTDGPFFFHTNTEPDPAITIDIGLQTIHKVVLTNRRDCCQDRAVPLVIESSAPPGNNWRLLARRDDSFTEWAATFPPIVASKIRIRALHTTYLHLADVEVY
jgi:hypothetical protein